MFNIFKSKKKNTAVSYAAPVVGMTAKHISGNYGTATATIVKVKGNKIVAEITKFGIMKERNTYVHVAIPASEHNGALEYYVREDQQNLVLSEKVIMPTV